MLKMIVKRWRSQSSMAGSANEHDVASFYMYAIMTNFRAAYCLEDHVLSHVRIVSYAKHSSSPVKMDSGYIFNCL